LCVLIVPGVAVGATAAQPGEALWNVKRGMEHARLVMAVGPSRDAVIHADLAARRLTELNQLLSRDGADPAVVDTVIHSLRDHTESATDQLNQTAVAERAAVADRLDGSVERQIAVIDMFLGFDCAEQAGPHCVALTGTRVASVRLQRTTTAIAAADAASDGPAEGPAPDTNAPADVAGVEPSDVDSALSASATASEPPSEPSSEGAAAEPSEDSTAAPSTPAAGEGTSETSGDESSGSSDPPSDPESQPSSPSSSTDSGSSTDPGSSTNSGSSTTSTVEKLGSDLDDATDAVTESLLP
jgi:hypothetical protein